MSVLPKYRTLTTEELHSLEKEFIDFLIVNGIMADDWEKMKDENSVGADDIITLFSDVILEGILRKTMFLEFKERTSIKAFQCLNEKIVLVGLDGNDSLDLMKHEDLKNAMINPPKGFKIYSTEKPYNTTREEELFKMIQSGCAISDGEIFEILSLAMV